MRINNNIMAMNAHRQLAVNQTNGAKSMERLSSGMRINRAGDAAAGLAISEKMRGQIRGLKQAQRNAQDGISLIQTAEGNLNETHSILQRMRELAVQAANDTNDTSVDRTAIKNELDQLVTELDLIRNTAQFNTKKLLNGSLNASIGTVDSGLTVNAGFSDIKIAGAAAGTYTIGVSGTAITVSYGTNSQTIDIGTRPTGFDTKEVTFGSMGVSLVINSNITDIDQNNTFEVAAGDGISLMIGANATENMQISIGDMGAAALGVASLDVSTATTAEAASTAINDAINIVSAERSKLGAYQNRLEHTINNLGTSAENLQAAESRIRDLDMAEEIMAFTKNNILQQAATAMLAQANMAPQSVLQLLG